MREKFATDINVGDTIYRQDAIDCVSEMLNGMFVEHEDIAKKAIGKLPSAQPTYTDEEIQKMQDLESAEIEKAYQLGYEDGMKFARPDRKSAKWVKTEIGWKCSNCTLCTNIKGKSEFKYCPNCGCRMEGDEE